jgi:hypothetical protein
MEQSARKSRNILVGAAILVAASIATGVAFAGWFRHSAGIVMTYAESGLSWCF